MNFFSLDLNKLINTLLFLEVESLLEDSRIFKMSACGVKIGNTNLFRKHWTKSAHKPLTPSHS